MATPPARGRTALGWNTVLLTRSEAEADRRGRAARLNRGASNGAEGGAGVVLQRRSRAGAVYRVAVDGKRGIGISGIEVVDDRVQARAAFGASPATCC